MNYRKITAFITALAMATTMAGCTLGNTSSETSESTAETSVEVTEDTQSVRSSHDSARSPEEEQESEKVTGQVKSVSGTEVTLLLGELTRERGSSEDKQANEADSTEAEETDNGEQHQRREGAYSFTPSESGEEVTIDLADVEDIDMSEIEEGKILVITLDDEGNPVRVKIRTIYGSEEETADEHTDRHSSENERDENAGNRSNRSGSSSSGQTHSSGSRSRTSSSSSSTSGSSGGHKKESSSSSDETSGDQEDITDEEEQRDVQSEEQEAETDEQVATTGSAQVIYSMTGNVMELALTAGDNTEISVIINEGCTWVLTGDCVITDIELYGDIEYNGYTVTLADGTVLSEPAD